MTYLLGWHPMRFEELADGSQSVATSLGVTAFPFPVRVKSVYAIARATIAATTAAGVYSVKFGSTTVGTITVVDGDALGTLYEVVWGEGVEPLQILKPGTVVSVVVATMPTDSSSAAALLDLYIATENA